MAIVVNAIDINPTSFPGARVTSIGQILNVALPLAMLGAAFLFLIMMLRGAFQWLTAEGNADNVVKAQKTMTFAAFGIAVVFLSFLAVKLITFVLNVPGFL